MDDIAADMLVRWGPGWIDAMPAYSSLAASRGLPIETVVDAASRDDLASILMRPVVTGTTGDSGTEPAQEQNK